MRRRRPRRMAPAGAGRLRRDSTRCAARASDVNYDVEINGRRRQVAIVRAGGLFRVTFDGRAFDVDVARIGPHVLSLIVTTGEVRPKADATSGSGEVRLKADATSAVVASGFSRTSEI